MINTKTIVQTQARALARLLASQAIPIRYTNAIDLVCASYGLRSRNALRTSTSLTANSSELLAEVANRILSTKPAWIKPAISATRIITHPSVPITDQSDQSENWITLEFSRQEIGFSQADLFSRKNFCNSNGFDKLTEAYANSCYYSRYSRDQGSAISLKEGNRYAELLLADDSNENGFSRIENEIEGHYACDALQYSGNPDTDSLIEEIIDLVAETHGQDWAPPEGIDSWSTELRQAIIDKLEEADESSVMDVFNSYDRCEVIFWLGDKDLHWEDRAISTNYCTSRADHLVINRDLQLPLAKMGYSLGEFRKLAKNKQTSSTDKYSRPKSGVRVAKKKMVTPDQLVEVIDNACTSYFGFCLYTIVPLADIAEIDRTKPITFTNAHLASYNPSSGTFHEVKIPNEVTVSPSDGKLDRIWGYGPDDICGFVQSHFSGRITNPKTRVSRDG